jgi:hypothetical protein
VFTSSKYIRTWMLNLQTICMIGRLTKWIANNCKSILINQWSDKFEISHSCFTISSQYFFKMIEVDRFFSFSFLYFFFIISVLSWISENKLAYSHIVTCKKIFSTHEKWRKISIKKWNWSVFYIIRVSSLSCRLWMWIDEPPEKRIF